MTAAGSRRKSVASQAVDGGGHCGTVGNMRDAGALRDECGFAECVWLRWDKKTMGKGGT